MFTIEKEEKLEQKRTRFRDFKVYLYMWLAHRISRTRLEWTGFVKRGFVKRGLVKRGFVKRGLVNADL